MKEDVTLVVNNLYETQILIIRDTNTFIDSDIDNLFDIDFKNEYSKNILHMELNKLRDNLEKAICKECTKFLIETINIISDEMES